MSVADCVGVELPLADKWYDYNREAFAKLQYGLAITNEYNATGVRAKAQAVVVTNNHIIKHLTALPDADKTPLVLGVLESLREPTATLERAHCDWGGRAHGRRLLRATSGVCKQYGWW